MLLLRGDRKRQLYRWIPVFFVRRIHMKNKEEMKKEILSFIEEEKKTYLQLKQAMKVSSFQEKKEFEEALLELELEGKMYEKDGKDFLPLTPLHHLDKVVAKGKDLFLAQEQVKIEAEVRGSFSPFPNDLVIVKKGSAPILEQIIKHDTASVIPFFLKLLEERPLHYKQIRAFFLVKTKKQQLELLKTLHQLELEGKVWRQENTYTAFPTDYYITTLQHSSHGITYYLTQEEKRHIVKEDELNGAFPSDTIVASKKGKHIIKVLKRGQEQVVMEVEEKDGVKHLKPVLIPGGNQVSVRISSHDMKSLVDGDRIVVHIGTKQYDENCFEGNYLGKIGHIHDPNTFLSSIAISKGFPITFREETIHEAKALPGEVSEEEAKNRIDLRNETIFTIDCPTTKDMDDAISLKKLENGNYLLGVHIAHVSHYIKPDMKLYEEAYQRGTSLYLLNTVNPMFPHSISNGICSLNPNVDRLTKTCQIEIDPSGKIINYDIFDSVIHSKIKMDYDSVNQFLADETKKEEYLPFQKDLFLMKELSNIIDQRKYQNGYLPFASNDIEAVFDEEGKVTAFQAIDQQTAGRMIENFMIYANCCVDNYLKWLPFASIHRIHEEISHENVLKAIEKLKILNFKIKASQNEKDKFLLQSILKDYATSSTYPIVSKIILTSLARAEYSTEDDIGHFGLGLKDYTHFTSPIRRFPDLQVQTLLDAYQENKSREAFPSQEQLQIICEHCSYMERQADLAEQEALYLKMLEYAEQHQDKYYHAFVTEIGPNRALLTTSNHIPGYLDYSNMQGNVLYCSSREYLKNRQNQVVLKVGDELLVKTKNSDYQELKVNFAFEKNLTMEKEQRKGATALKVYQKRKIPANF